MFNHSVHHDVDVTLPSSYLCDRQRGLLLSPNFSLLFPTVCRSGLSRHGCPSFIAPLSPVWLCLGLTLREVTELVHQASVFRLFAAIELDYVSGQDHRSAIQGPYLTYLRRHNDTIGLPVRLGGD